MISLNEMDRKFYSDNAGALLSYIRYIEFVIENREKFGGNNNVELALHIGKFIGRNGIDQSEFKEIEVGVGKLCKSSEKARGIMKILKDEEKLQTLIIKIIRENPKAYMVAGPNGEILADETGNPIPNIMKLSLAIAKELGAEC